MAQNQMQPDYEAPPKTPRWVKIFGIIAIIFVLLFGILHLTGNSLSGHQGHLLPTEHPTEESIQRP